LPTRPPNLSLKKSMEAEAERDQERDKSPRSHREDQNKSPRGIIRIPILLEVVFVSFFFSFVCLACSISFSRADLVSPRGPDGVKRTESKSKLFGRSGGKDKIERCASVIDSVCFFFFFFCFGICNLPISWLLTPRKPGKDAREEEKKKEDVKKKDNKRDDLKKGKGRKSNAKHPSIGKTAHKPVLWSIVRIDTDNGEIGKRFVDSLIQWLEAYGSLHLLVLLSLEGMAH
jgi:hypothetical protein